MKIVFGIIAVGIITGATVYVISNKNKKGNTDVHEKEPQNTEPETSVTTRNNDLAEESAELADVKNSAIDAISERHKEAAKIMKDALESIYGSCESSGNEEHELEHISDELDELLKEE